MANVQGQNGAPNKSGSSRGGDSEHVELHSIQEPSSQVEMGVDLNELIESMYKSHLNNKLAKLHTELREFRKNETANSRRNYAISVRKSSLWDFELVLRKATEKASDQPASNCCKISLKQAIDSLHRRLKDYEEVATTGETQLGIALPVLDLAEQFDAEDAPYSRRATHLLACYSQADQRFPKLAYILKNWRSNKFVGLNKVGDFTSYPLVTMLVQYLQTSCSPPVLPCLQDSHPKLFGANVCSGNLHRVELDFKSKNLQDAGDLLIGFFKYLGLPFDQANLIAPKKEVLSVDSDKREGLGSSTKSVAHVVSSKNGDKLKESGLSGKSIHIHLHFN